MQHHIAVALHLVQAQFNAVMQVFVVRIIQPAHNLSLRLDDHRTAVVPSDHTVDIIQKQISLIIDIGGFTADYLLLRNGEGDLSVCDSLENGVILLYNRIKSRVAAEQDLLLDEAEIDAILLGRDSGQPDAVSQIVRHQAQEFVSDLLSSLRERMLELKSGKVIFTGGGAVLLRQQIEASDKVREPVFIEDIAANVKGYQLLYQAERIGRHNGY